MASKIISGIFGGKGTPAVNSWDAMHTFSTRSADHFGGKMHAGAGYAGGQVGKALQEFYNNQKLNPCITSIKITVDPKEWTTAWEVTIDESPDGKAYVGLNSWGGASGGYPAKKPPGAWAYSNYVKEKKAVIKNYPGAELKDVLDFYIPGGFRQIFFQYTIPNKFPDLPKSATAKKGTVGVKIGASGSPSGLPEYNGMLMPTVTIEPDQLQEVKSEKTEEIQKKPDPNPIPEIPVPKPLDPRSINGKFSLKVKSGPGVIIGITDVDIVDGKADFDGIQFDQPGDYVVIVSSTSPDIDSAEIKIKVLPEPAVIPQESKGEPEKEVSGTRPIITQIDPPTLPLFPMEFDTFDAPPSDQVAVATSIGNLPFFSYNGSVINDRDIQQFRLYHDGILPKVKITFRDSNNLISDNPPQDDTTFDIFIKSWSDNLKSIHMVFKVEDHQKMENNLYSMTGTIDNSDLYRIKFKVYRGTSFNVIREICKDLKLGFNSNIEASDDEMPWRNIGDRTYKFIGNTIEHSYISEESFMGGYIDFYYCFNYVDLEKEMKRDISNDVGIDTGPMSNGKTKDTDKITNMVFMSEKGLQNSSFYFIKTSEKNESTRVSLQQGYKTRTKFYDKVKKMFLVFDVDSTTSDESGSIIMKGKTNDKEAFDNNYTTKYAGKIDTDNVHKNHNYAVTQNRINLDNMMKNQMTVKLPNPNYNIYRYQKIYLYVVKEAPTIGSNEAIEWRFSGEWLISEISYEYSGKKFYQELKLVRKEMGKNPKEMTDKENTPAAKPETKDQKNENPLTEAPSENITNKPNDAYKVGETYTVQDKDGKKYIVTIKKISENGTDVVAEVRDIDYVLKQTTTNPESIAGVTKTEIPTVGPPASLPPATASGKYNWPVTFKRYKEELSQYQVTLATSYYRFFSPFPGNNLTGQASIISGIYIDKEQNLKIAEKASVGLWIAIKRPEPDFKPEGLEKKETPHVWIMYELNDGGTIADSKKDSAKYEITKTRLLNTFEAGFAFTGASAWKKPKGSITITNESNVKVIDSERDQIDETAGIEYTKGSKLVPSNLDNWFESIDGTKPIDKDELYTEVGGPNTIFLDMSNRRQYPPGTYTIEVRYMVPKYLENSNVRLIEPRDIHGYSPYEEKIFKEIFTISKNPKKR